MIIFKKRKRQKQKKEVCLKHRHRNEVGLLFVDNRIDLTVLGTSSGNTVDCDCDEDDNNNNSDNNTSNQTSISATALHLLTRGVRKRLAGLRSVGNTDFTVKMITLSASITVVTCVAIMARITLIQITAGLALLVARFANSVVIIITLGTSVTIISSITFRASITLFGAAASGAFHITLLAFTALGLVEMSQAHLATVRITNIAILNGALSTLGVAHVISGFTLGASSSICADIAIVIVALNARSFNSNISANTFFAAININALSLLAVVVTKCAYVILQVKISYTLGASSGVSADIAVDIVALNTSSLNGNKSAHTLSAAAVVCAHTFLAVGVACFASAILHVVTSLAFSAARIVNAFIFFAVSVTR